MNLQGRNPQSAVSIEEFARLQTTSRLARTGQRLIQTAQIITAFESLITVIAVAALWCFAFPLSAHAQTTSGEIFGNDQQIGNAIREAVGSGKQVLTPITNGTEHSVKNGGNGNHATARELITLAGEK